MIYPVRNNGPILPPGQRPPGLAAAVEFHFSTIPTGYNTLLGFEPFDGAHGPEYVEGSQRLEFLTGFTKWVRAE